MNTFDALASLTLDDEKPVDDFAAQIELLARLSARSRFARLCYRIEYFVRWVFNTPMAFRDLTKAGTGNESGSPFRVVHKQDVQSLHHEARSHLTWLVLVAGGKTTGYRCVHTTFFGRNRAATIVQPLYEPQPAPAT